VSNALGLLFVLCAIIAFANMLGNTSPRHKGAIIGAALGLAVVPLAVHLSFTVRPQQGDLGWWAVSHTFLGGLLFVLGDTGRFVVGAICTGAFAAIGAIVDAIRQRRKVG
jgi:heme/copper-type cytochrome/quinol oxidase subunit 4